MLLILSSQNSPRFDYVCKVIFEHILGLDYIITQDEKKYMQHTDFKLRYIAKSNILFETDIRKQDESLILQDKPALAFYLLTNYEEYLPDCPRDQHGRIVHEQSFVVRQQLYKQAVVHRIALEYRNLLSKQKDDFKWKKIEYRFIPSFDIDIAYAYKGKRFLHFIGAASRAFLGLRWSNLTQLFKAVGRSDFQDPYDVYDIERELCTKYGIRPLYFVLTSRRTRYDRNISPQSKCFIQLLQQLKQYATIGIHPSYYSYNQSNIENEKKCLEQAGNIKIKVSRQHYLKVKFPESFKHLLSAGITDDYSLGFYDRIGFRNGMAIAFPFFDVSSNQLTKLMLHPLLMMDSAAVQSLGQGDDYWTGVSALVQEVKAVGGDMTALWHSNFMPHNSQELKLFQKTFELMGHK